MNKNKQNDGVAHLKHEFIIPVETNHEKQAPVETNHEKQTPVETNHEKQAPVPTSVEGDSSTVEPPTKKQKLEDSVTVVSRLGAKYSVSSGSTKRPRLVKAPKSSKLCRSVWCLRVGEDGDGKCTFPKCDFLHDIPGFMQSKPEDIGPKCHIYQTYGMCHHGFTCRFGVDHIEGLGNIVNEDLWAKFKNNPPVSNILKKEVQHRLRRRKYDFTKAVQIHRKVQSDMAKVVASDQNRTVEGVQEKQNKSLDGKQERTLPEEKSCDGIEKNGDCGKNNVENGSQICTENSVCKDHENGSGRDDVEEGSRTCEIDNEKLQHTGSSFLGPTSEEDIIKPTARERKKLEWRGKTYLAPLTTLGNLPFRRICKSYGADITCGEMALASCLLQGSPSEWALVKRHSSEDCFGIQVCGSSAETMIKCAQLLNENTEVDFVDINMGCPIDLIYKKGGGSALMRRHGCVEHMVRGMTGVLDKPLTLKMRTAVYHDARVAHTLIKKAKLWDVSMITLHGRSREQRYLKLADWNYINECAAVADPLPLFGNGDILSFEDYNYHMEHTKVSGIMIGRGALIKPWIFKEIKEQRHWDISSSERFDMLKEYVNCGLEHWGSDSEGVEKTRRFLLEWLSFLHRYIPVGLLEQTQKINQRPPTYHGRDDLETMMASRSVNDWIKISEMLLGPTPSDFLFMPKHKANAY
ncbi:tRNA-dihydrouridine(47) synthase [NAD(P)(+)]-like isoform X2 [Panulirus ornatus]|uniref:tRNA-dihydrouridine(47) synthase [NAD(P)(+)]-like isoform X2 n=1 Tax=Panulirus ornatus TaxID=150431 RepID=UPI003A87F42F